LWGARGCHKAAASADSAKAAALGAPALERLSAPTLVMIPINFVGSGGPGADKVKHVFHIPHWDTSQLTFAVKCEELERHDLVIESE